jgi:transposase
MATQSQQSSDTLKNNKIEQVEVKSDQKINTTTNAFTTTSQQETVANPQVKPARSYTPRRTFDKAYKVRVLASFDACSNGAERSALLRREGLYYARICAWRHEQTNGKLKNKDGKNKIRTDHLANEIAQLKKKLAQAEAIIDLQKKVSELFGLHTQQHDVNEVS